MIPDLGKYTGTVLSAFAASILMILALVGWSLWQAARSRRALEEIEGRQAKAQTGAIPTESAE